MHKNDANIVKKIHPQYKENEIRNFEDAIIEIFKFKNENESEATKN